MAAKRKPHPHTCERCPNRFSDHGCPFYMTGEEGITEQDTVNGVVVTRQMKGCIFTEGHLFRWLAHSVVSNAKSQAAVESTRNEMVKGMTLIGQQMTDAMAKFGATVEQISRQVTAVNVIGSLVETNRKEIEAPNGSKPSLKLINRLPKGR